MFCPHCQTNNRRGSKYCNECGFPLTGLIAQSESENATPPLSSLSSHAEDTKKQTDIAVIARDKENDAASKQASPTAQEHLNNTAQTTVTPQSSTADSDTRQFSNRPSVALPIIEIQKSHNSEGSTSSQHISEVPTNASTSTQTDTSSLDALGVGSELQGVNGSTMELPLVADPSMPARSGYRAPDANPPKKHRPARIFLIIVALIAVAGCATAATTYSLGLWDGKLALLSGETVPDVLGMTRADATYTLENLGFTVRATEVVSDETEGLVLLSDPVSGSYAEEGAEVVIHVSVARTIPEVLGMSQTDAQTALSEAGYTRIEVVTEKSNEEAGTVLAISPEPNTKANASTAITLTVAEPYYVPDVAGLTQDEATELLEAEGYVVNVINTYNENYESGTVISSDPTAESQLDSGSTITIYIAKSRALELFEVTYGIIYRGANLTIGGTAYTVVTLENVAYRGSNTVYYRFTGINASGTQVTVDGTIVYDDDNEIISSASSPSFSKTS